MRICLSILRNLTCNIFLFQSRFYLSRWGLPFRDFLFLPGTPAVNIHNLNSWGSGIAIELENEGETYFHSGENVDPV